jgi:hypothetical protein
MMKKITTTLLITFLILVNANALVITGKVYELPDMIPSHYAVVHLPNLVGHATKTDQHGHFTLNIKEQLPEKIDLEIHSVYRIGIRITNIHTTHVDTIKLDKLHIFKPDRKVLPKFIGENSSGSAINNKHKIPKSQHILINHKHYEVVLNLKDERYELDMDRIK